MCDSMKEKIELDMRKFPDSIFGSGATVLQGVDAITERFKNEQKGVREIIANFAKEYWDLKKQNPLHPPIFAGTVWFEEGDRVVVAGFGLAHQPGNPRGSHLPRAILVSCEPSDRESCLAAMLDLITDYLKQLTENWLADKKVNGNN